MELLQETENGSTWPASVIAMDCVGRPILVDPHVRGWHPRFPVACPPMTDGEIEFSLLIANGFLAYHHRDSYRSLFSL